MRYDSPHATQRSTAMNLTDHKTRLCCFLSPSLLARFSLASIVVTLASSISCLITSATEYPEPKSSPPFLDANTALATPMGMSGVPITKLLLVDQNTQSVTLTADVRSDDAGRPVHSRVFINYTSSSAADHHYDQFFGGKSIAAGTFDDVRRISASFDPSSLRSEGCFQVSLVVTHEFDNERFIPVSPADTSIIVWWMIVGDPSAIGLDRCPGVLSRQESDASGGM